MSEATVEVMSTPAVARVSTKTYVYKKTICPFMDKACVGGNCKFWFADDCIILKLITKIYFGDL